MGKSKFTVSLDTDGITKQVADAAFKSVLYQVADQILGELTKKNAFFRRPNRRNAPILQNVKDEVRDGVYYLF